MSIVILLLVREFTRWWAPGYGRWITLCTVRLRPSVVERQAYLVGVSEPRCVALLPTIQHDPFAACRTISFPSFIIGQGSDTSRTWKRRAHDSDTMAEVLVVYCFISISFIQQEGITYTNKYCASSSAIYRGDMLHTIPLAACRLL